MQDLILHKEDPFRAGVIIGSGIGSLQEVEKEYEKIMKPSGPGQCESVDGATDDFQYGSRKCFDSAWIHEENVRML